MFNRIDCAASTIHLSAMADRHYQHHKTVLLDGGDDAVIANPIAPKSLAVAGQRMAEEAEVLAAGDAFAQVAQYPLLRVCAELRRPAEITATIFSDARVDGVVPFRMAAPSFK